MVPSSPSQPSARASQRIDPGGLVERPPGDRPMAQRTLGERVESLKKKAESLRKLPIRVGRLEDRLGSVEDRVGSLEVQVVQLRQEMHDGFFDVKKLIGEGDEATRPHLP